ncbi:unnamed protein product, partial [Brassica rapa]
TGLQWRSSREVYQRVKHSTCHPLNRPYVASFFDSSATKVMMFVNFTGESAESLKSKFRKVATSYKGQGLPFLVGDAEGGKGALEYFGVQESQVPLVIIQTPDNKKYLKANVVVEEIESWMKDFKGRKENFQKIKGPNANSLTAHGTEYNQT